MDASGDKRPESDADAAGCNSSRPSPNKKQKTSSLENEKDNNEPSNTLAADVPSISDEEYDAVSSDEDLEEVESLMLPYSTKSNLKEMVMDTKQLEEYMLEILASVR